MHIGIEFSTGVKMDKIIPWRKVAAIHRTIAGVSIDKGFVRSLLCSTGSFSPYPNEIKGNKIYRTVHHPKGRSDSPDFEIKS